MDINQRSGGLDFIKVLATIGIFFHHYQQDFDVVFTNHINFFNGLLYWGYLVELFFIISGFVIARYIPVISRGDADLDTWFAHRLRRILPMVAVSAVCFEAIYLLYRYTFSFDFLNIPRKIALWPLLISALGLQTGGVFSATNINNPLWYLSVLIICYLAFYICCALSARLRCKAYYLFVMMIFIGLGIKEYCIVLPFFNVDSARGYISFFTGVLLSLYAKNYGVSRTECFFSAAVLALFGLLLALKPDLLLAHEQYVMCFIVFPAVVLLMDSPLAKKLFRHKFWAKCSAVSFNVYVWHVPLFIAFEIIRFHTGIAPGYGKLSTMYMLLALVWLFAVFSHKFIELPLDKAVTRAARSLNMRKQLMNNPSVK